MAARLLWASTSQLVHRTLHHTTQWSKVVLHSDRDGNEWSKPNWLTSYSTCSQLARLCTNSYREIRKASLVLVSHVQPTIKHYGLIVDGQNDATSSNLLSWTEWINFKHLIWIKHYQITTKYRTSSSNRPQLDALHMTIYCSLWHLHAQISKALRISESLYVRPLSAQQVMSSPVVNP